MSLTLSTGVAHAGGGFWGVLISCAFAFHTCQRRIRRFTVNNTLRLAEQVSHPSSFPPPGNRRKKEGKEKKSQVDPLIPNIYFNCLIKLVKLHFSCCLGGFFRA